MKRLLFLCVLWGGGTAVSGAQPGVSDVTFLQGDDRVVTIAYRLSNAPAVITVDVQTNTESGAWASVGGSHLRTLSGAVMCRVEPSADLHHVTWRPDREGLDDWGASVCGIRAVVTAWPTNDTPDYLVVDLTAGAAGGVRYYPTVEALPGGLMENPAYRMTKLVLRRIRAKGVTWQMGTTADRWGVPYGGAYGADGANGGSESPHEVTLDHDYYMGIFELTQAQWATLREVAHWSYFQVLGKEMRPVDSVSYCALREGDANGTAAADGDWSYPNAPYPGSLCGRLRARTGLDFDLPSEAEWEFAARGGHGDGFWGDGRPIAYGTGRYESWWWDGQLDARYGGAGLVDMPEIRGYSWHGEEIATVGVERGTAAVGSYPPNGFGLYDMAGNVYEWCLDWYKADIAALNGAVNTAAERNERILRGGSQYCEHGAVDCRPSRRLSRNPAEHLAGVGARVVCRAGLE